KAREAARLLDLDVRLRAHHQDRNGAMLSCLAILNSSRSIGDEPMLVSVLVRLAIRAIVLARLERVLGQMQIDEPALAAFQRSLEEDERQLLRLNALRGERGGTDKAVETLDPTQIHRYLGGGPFEPLILFESLRSQRAALLRHYTALVEA